MVYTNDTHDDKWYNTNEEYICIFNWKNSNNYYKINEVTVKYSLGRVVTLARLASPPTLDKIKYTNYKLILTVNKTEKNPTVHPCFCAYTSARTSAVSSHLHDRPLYSFATSRRLSVLAPTPLPAWENQQWTPNKNNKQGPETRQ